MGVVTGIRGTYQGLTATMMKQGTNQAIRFFVMESLKELYRGKDAVNTPVPKVITGVFGVVAGAASVFGNTPLDVIKTRMQVRLVRYPQDQQVCVQLPTSADDVTLPAFAAERSAAARWLPSAGSAAVDRYVLPAWPTAANPQQRRVVAKCWDRQTDT